MQLDKLSLVLRQRSAWEAFDVGILLYRRYAKTVYLAWVCTVLPFALLIAYLLRDYMFWAGIVFWWFKPLFDRLPLLVYSQGIFGAPLTLGQTLRALPRACTKGLLFALTFARFSGARSFALPISQLEGLSGRQRQKRLQVLSRRSSGSYSLTFLCVFLEYICSVGLLFLVFVFLPINADWNFYLESWWNWLQVQSTWFGFLTYGLYVLIVSVIEPLYVACGFSLYLNQRTILEGWDLEIGFRRLAQRLAHVGAHVGLGFFVALLAIGAMSFPSTSKAATQDPQQQLQSVLQSKPFDAKKEIETQKLKEGGWLDRLVNPKQQAEPPKVKKQRETDRNTKAKPELGGVAQATVGGVWYLLVGVGVVFLLAIAYQFFRKADFSSANALPAPALPAQVAGMDLQQKLPDDILSVARRLWLEGEHRQALALLYRGSLVYLARQYTLSLKASFTEGDCLRQIQQACPTETYRAFGLLNRAWLQEAYAQQTLQAEAFEALCHSYRQYLGGGQTV